MPNERSIKRHQVWQVVLGFLLLAGIVNGISLIVGRWFLAALPLAMVAAFLILKAKRMFSLRNKGYFAGRRSRDQWLYEERHNGQLRVLALELERTEPGHFGLFVPSCAEWCATVPLWAVNRREEIVCRIAESLKESDIHYPSDWQA